MTLSFWLRDYLYIPLGGNRGPEWRISVNIIITMLLGGLWHGAAWTFVAWGLYHGVGQVIGRQRRRRPREPRGLPAEPQSRGPGGLGPVRHLPARLRRMAVLPGRPPWETPARCCRASSWVGAPRRS